MAVALRLFFVTIREVIAELDKSIIHLVLTNKHEKVMKKGTMIIISTIILIFIGCARDKLYEDALMGTWKAHNIKQDGKWVNTPYNMQMSITIKPSGTYSANGYLGNVSGIWHLSKRNITFYIGEHEYMRCYVVHLWQDKCEFKITLDDKTTTVEFKKI